MFGKKVFIIFFSVIFFSKLFADGVLARPRKVNVVQTQYFDILFSKESSETARILADTADSLYEKAVEKLGGIPPLHIPVLISPDSDELSVTYTASPYNRIVIFDGVPGNDLSNFENPLLNLFYREVYKAVACSIRTPIHQMISKTVGGDAYQPVSLINLPDSFIEGRMFLEEGGDKPETSRFNDGYFLQILTQAKLENKFPDYFQACVTYDIYPGDTLMVAAYSAFEAWLIQTYGYQKYSDLWNKSGGVYPFFMSGLVYLVYECTIRQLWSDFSDSIPVPENLIRLDDEPEKVNQLFEQKSPGLYRYLVHTPHGIIWYDEIHHEVALYNPENKNKFKLLFLADDVQKLNISPDGKFLVVSYCQIKTDPEFKKQVVWIYDLEKNNFLSDYEICLRDGVIIQYNGVDALAGINVQDKIPKLQVYSITEKTEQSGLLFEKKFPCDVVPLSLVSLADNLVMYIFSYKNQKYLCRLDLKTMEEVCYYIQDSKNNIIDMQDLRSVSNGSEKFLTFQYALKNETCFTRIGEIHLNEMYEPADVLLQSVDLEGGVNYPFYTDSQIFFSSKKLEFDEINYSSIDTLELKAGDIIAYDGDLPQWEEKSELLSNKKLGDYDTSLYLPFKYLFPISFVPLVPIREISMEEGTILSPGLGFTVRTHSDPFMNNKIALSAAWKYLDLGYSQIYNVSKHFENEENYENQALRKDKTVIAYIENTSTPVDIRLGGILKYNYDGEYDFDLMFGTVWQVPFGMNFSNLKILVQSRYNASTDYFRPDMTSCESLSGWPSFKEAYQYLELSAKATYSNIHQYGRSTFEKRGLSVTAHLYTFWDLYSMNLLKKEYEASKQQFLAEGKTEDEAEKKAGEYYSTELKNYSQLNIGLLATLEVPRLNPLPVVNGWVLSLPATFSLEFMNNSGTFLDIKTEFLLLGKEIHKGLPFLSLYFSKLGLKGGYDFVLNYDAAKNVTLDLRNGNSYYEVFKNSYIDDSLFLSLNIDLSSPIGALSTKTISTVVKFVYYPRTQGYMLKANLIMNF